ncbi:bifunctional hydroxymethylpyrimidine kinase/phosphomethylpyrimidine kinase [Halopenitus sp. H-Gu1]|uniref:bifunctional hydroxymethylpyrimidine kinase/phosphomethylpyrimidine kinase n=1 Tax=Halopenitus sp. H-Gu1 TaxID=3242697 RepID=UPI00359CE27E
MTDSDTYDPIEPPIALTIAGSDSGGGAGIQADLKTMTVHDVYGTSVLAATTAQNTQGVSDVNPLAADHVKRQYDAVLDDFDVGAIKTGMLATAEIVEIVTDRLRGYEGPIVVDPVMVAATGDRLLSPAAEDAYEELIAEATLVTPNADEAAVLTGRDVEDVESAAAAARELLGTGADAALVKGGHLGGDRIVDTLAVATEPEPIRIESPRIETAATHGSGCTLSSAVAARLARGEPLRSAVETATREMTDAVRRGYDIGEGPGAVNPTQLDR